MSLNPEIPAWRRRTYHCSACGSAGHRRDRCTEVPAGKVVPEEATLSGELIAKLAEVQLGIDALTADIVWHEQIQATLAERIAEAYQQRAELEIEIRALRAGEAATP